MSTTLQPPTEVTPRTFATSNRIIRLVRRAERSFDIIARRRMLTCALVGVAAVGLRLSLSQLYGMPRPTYQDEFSYLLQGETFAMGRLANPTHRLWPFFETVHVNQQPTYSSKYPPGQGAFLAIGIKLFGQPWYGVLLSVGLMCACITWMIQGWIPARYALLGGLAAALQFSGDGYWVNSYWGGAVAAAGGALVLGALPRMLRRPTTSVALIAAIGILVLLNTRPFEGLVLVGASLFALLWRGRSKIRRIFALRVAGPAILVLALGAGGMAYYNSRITGHATELPYVVHQKRYGLAPLFWVQPRARTTTPAYRDKAMKDLWMWDLGLYLSARKNPLVVASSLASTSYATFIDGPMLLLIGLTLLGALTAVRHERLKLAVGIGGCFLCAVLMEKFVLAHYLAPAVALLFLFTAFGLRIVRLSRFRGARWGPPIVLGLLAASAAIFVRHNVRRIDPLAANPIAPRFAVEQTLLERGGKHVVLVRYSANHNFHYEYVYNGPDIDRQPIIWAIDRGVHADSVLQRYYPDRTVWLFNPDEPRVSLKRYGSN